MLSAMAALLLVVVLTAEQSRASTFTTIATFAGTASDPGHPLTATLTMDSSGNVYGTTFGEAPNEAHPRAGSVFELTPPAPGKSLWSKRVLYVFGRVTNGGMNPSGGVVFGRDGALFGTTEYGGIYGDGTVFRLRQTTDGVWNEDAIYNFNRAVDTGINPTTGLTVSDQAGTLFGASGNYSSTSTVFILSPPAHKTVRWKMQSIATLGESGVGSSLLFDRKGGVVGDYAPGIDGGGIFGIEQNIWGNWETTVLYSIDFFQNKKPWDETPGLVEGANGDLYGETSGGGAYYLGTIFKLSPIPSFRWPWSITVLSSFAGKTGYLPQAGMAFGKNGVLYGTTRIGGSEYLKDRIGNGVVFALLPSANGSKYVVLHNFGPGEFPLDGSHPQSAPILDSRGRIYGTTNDGGAYGAGTVYMITP